MDFNDFIGFPLEEVIQKLNVLSISYTIKENSDIQKQYDTLLVVKIVKIKEDCVELITDKFLLEV